MRMRKLLLGTSVLAGLSLAAGAQAADMPLKAQRAAPYYNWTGCYVGGHVGAAWNSGANWTNKEGTHFFTSIGQVDNFGDSNEFIGGGQVGCNYQTGQLVLGVEGTWSHVRFDDTLVRPGPFSLDTLRFRTSDITTFAGRLGWAWDRWLVYGKGGLATANVSIRASEEPFFPHFLQDTRRHHGFVAGFGVEYGWTQFIVLGLEYNFIGLNTKDHIGVDNIAFDPRYVIRVDPGDIHTVTARASFKFGP